MQLGVATRGTHRVVAGTGTESCLPRCVVRGPLLKKLDHAVEIRIASAEAARDPVPSALADHLAVRDHIELTDFARRADRFDM